MKRTCVLSGVILASLLALGCAPASSQHPDASPDAGTTADKNESDAPGSDGQMSDGQGLDSQMTDGATADGTTDSTPADGGPPVQTCFPPPDKDHPFEKLSQTGCMDPKQITKFAPTAYRYEVNSPLWSDGADKERGFFLPAGGKVHVRDCEKASDACFFGPQDSGKFVFPVGTVMAKSFGFDRKLVETRLFVHFDANKWVGYSYQWNDAQTEATIVDPTGLQVEFNTGSRKVGWTYPTRDDCMLCHLDTAGYTLGPELRQLNRVVEAENQLDRLGKAGIFDEALKAPYPDALATPYSGSWGAATASASIEEKARSYLHANCGFCHRPDGNFASLDLRYGVNLYDTATCNVEPRRSDTGVMGAMLIRPGSAKTSTTYLRMADLRSDIRMPSVASSVVDQDALKLIGDWINSMTACPEQP